MKTILIALAFMATVGVASAELPPPTHADVAYGSHPRNVLDLWLASSDKPTPLLVNIHGDVEHKGKHPKHHAVTGQSGRELIRLRRELKEAVDREEYERASELRDKIKTMEGHD